MNIIEWITSLGESATTCITGGGCGDWSVLLGGITQIFIWPIRFIVDFVLAWIYILGQIFNILLFLVSPLNCIIQFLIGIIQSWQTPQILSNAFVVPAGMITFLNAIPGFTYFEILLLAIFWYLIFRKTLETFKY